MRTGRCPRPGPGENILKGGRPARKSCILPVPGPGRLHLDGHGRRRSALRRPPLGTIHGRHRPGGPGRIQYHPGQAVPAGVTAQYQESSVPWTQVTELTPEQLAENQKYEEWNSGPASRAIEYNEWGPTYATNPYTYTNPNPYASNRVEYLWQMAPEQQVQYLLDQAGNRTGASPVPTVPTITTQGTNVQATVAPTVPAKDPTAQVIDYNQLGLQGDMGVFDQYLRQNPQYASALQGNTESKRLQAPASVPTFASTPNAGNWVNEDAWKNIWGKTFYPQSNMGSTTTATTATSANPSSQDTWKKIFGNTFYGGSSGF